MIKKKILIVDDEAGITKMIKLALEQTGRYDVRAENKSARALPAAWDYQPDLIILDVVMPGIDGVDIARLMKADRRLKSVPIIFLTATVTRDDAEEEWQQKAIYIRKPATLPELINGIEQAIEAGKLPQTEEEQMYTLQ